MNGHTVETAINGSIGFERLKKAYATRDVDMLITDLQMLVMVLNEQFILFALLGFSKNIHTSELYLNVQ
jgi:hypothetical protein